MHVFEVWAPQARTVEVKIGDEKFPWPVKRGAGGRLKSPRQGPGTDYGFVLDGLEPPLPDPRTRWQPYGVHGDSRVVDDGAFPGATAAGNRRLSPVPSSTSCMSARLPRKERSKQSSPTWTI